MMLSFVTVRGTGEQHQDPNSMLGQVAKTLYDQVQWLDTEYPSSIAVFNPQGNPLGVSEQESRRKGVTALAQTIRDTPNRVVVAGYSLGSLVVSDFMQAKAQGQYRDCYIDAVVDIASPSRRAGESYGHPSFGYGLNGQHGSWPSNIPHYQIANPQDLITSAPANSPVRIFADKVRTFALTEQGAAEWFATMLAQLLGEQAIQAQAHLFDLAWWQAYAEAPAWLRGYVWDGQHQVRYQQQPLWWDEQGKQVTGVQLAAEAVAKYV